MALDRSQFIKVYTNRLVKSLVPPEFGTEFIQSVNNDLVQVLLSTPDQGGSIQQKQYEINQIRNRYKSMFLSKGLKQEWTLFQNILDSLSEVKSLDQIYNYLVFFSTLQSQSEPDLRMGSPRVIGSHLSNKSYSSASTNVRTGMDQLQSSPYKDPEALNKNPSKGLHNQYEGIKNHTPSRNISQIIALQQIIEPYYQTLSEELILTYLSYTLLGLDSKLLSFQTDKEIELPSSINNSYTSVLLKILECALLYKNLIRFVHTNKGKLESPIKTAFLSVLEVQLGIYVNHINLLFNSQPSSLIAVYNSLYDWILKFRVLYSLETKLHDLNGYDFLSKSYELTKSGDLRIKQLGQVIFQHISTPYYQILESWVINGELIDSSDEFFIKFEFENNDFNSIIQFLPSRIPFFIDNALSYKIFQIGKTLIFLTKYCRELKWVNQYSSRYSHLLMQVNNGLQSMSINELHDIINQQYDELINYLTIVLQGSKNHMYEHLINFKKYYLIQNNDFIDSVILKGSDLLNESSSNISSNYLSQILNDSISHSSIKYNKFAERFDARVLDPKHGNIGWEVFTVQYRIEDLPIYWLVEGHMEQYLKMFNFLWKLRYLQSMLNNSFVESLNIKKHDLKDFLKSYFRIRRTGNNGIRDRKVVWLMKSFNAINLIRNGMIQFLNSIVGYLSFDIIEESFKKLVTEKLFKSTTGHLNGNNVTSLLRSLNPQFVKTVRGNVNASETTRHNCNELTFDELIEMHEKYLNTIVNNKLLNEDTIGKQTKKSYIQQIYNILDDIFMFIKSGEEFNNLIVNYILVKNIEESNQNTHDAMDRDMEEIEIKLLAITTKIHKQLHYEYKSKKDQFVRDLKSDLELRELSQLFN
jgi:gamma-tubulin complex component 3